MARKILNFLLYEIVWFACVLGAGHGHPWMGVIAAVGLLTFHVAATDRPGREIRLILLCALVGYISDSALVYADRLNFPPHAHLGGPSPLWMVALWACFATTFNTSLDWLKGRYLIAGLIGLIGGPLSYLAGERFAALQLPEPRVLALASIAVEWAAAIPVLFFFNRVLSRQAEARIVAAQGVA